MSTSEEIYVVAVSLPEHERSAYLDEACEDPGQREQVEDLLRTRGSGTTPCAMPDIPPPGPAVPEGPGALIGPYKILQQIGEGGFGIVYEAEQRRPFERRVALKVIKPGMDTKEVIARFEAERQALALMDHPNVAQVLDAGTTPAGLPYFVMELVKGVPLLQFCDEQKCDTRQRLELFLDVCSGVNHAHQKGIIHRDLKPANILVTRVGDRALPKIIDFGIAKATRQKLTDKTLFTRFEQFVGTPLYLSPEQATLSGLDIDTRSDIYTLGVVLYELLAGRPPFEPRSLLDAGYEEMRRIIREVDPPKPSTRVSTLQGADRLTIGLTHRADAKKLRSLIHGELDWIVMKAIEKDRSRRYETANAFAKDIRHFLDDEPVSAAAPGAAYRFRKFARRNKGRLAAAGTVALALLVATVAASWQTVHANRENRRANVALEQLRATAPAFLSQAENLVQKQHFDDALAKIDHALDLQPESVDYLLAKAELLECLLRFRAAAGVYGAVLEVEPGHVGARDHRQRCEDMLVLKSGEADEYPREQLESLFDALRKEQRPAAALIPLALRLGREAEILRDYWLARLRGLPIGPDRPLADRLSITDEGLLGLDLSNTPISDLRVLEGIPLQSLLLTGCESVKDLAPLRDMPLEKLGLSGTAVEDLSPLRTMRSLTLLDVHDMPIGNLNALQGLKLTVLRIDSCPAIDDLAPLRGMPLEHLGLGNTPVKSLAPLSGMPLRRLGLLAIPADDVEALRGLPLEELYLLGNTFRDLSFLEGMPLRLLKLAGCSNARNFGVLPRLESLEVLVLPSTCLSLPREDQEAIDTLKSHPRLRQISDRDPGSQLSLESKLPTKEFWARWEQTRCVSRPLQRAGIEFTLDRDDEDQFTLHISDPRFTDLSFLEEAKKKGAVFGKLYLGDTGISDLSPLRGLPLEDLRVYGTKVEDLEPLAEMDTLQRLEIARTPVRDLSPLRNMPLRYLTFDGTEVTDSSPLAEIWSLESIMVSRSVEDLEALRSLPHLERLSLWWDSVHHRPLTRSDEFWGVQAIKRHDWTEARRLLGKAGLETARHGEIDEENGIALHRAGTVVALVGDPADYESLCREILARFGESDVAGALAHAAKVALLREGPLVREAYPAMQRAYDLADGWNRGGWFDLLMTQAEYRIGNYGGASEYLDRIDPRADLRLRIPTMLFRAMIAQQQGDFDVARTRLGNAVQAAKVFLKSFSDGLVHERFWQEPLYCQIFIEEAEELIWVRSISGLLAEGKFSEAELQSRQWLAIREELEHLDEVLPPTSRVCDAQTMLAACLLGQGKLAEAESLLLAAYQDMEQRDRQIPGMGGVRFRENIRYLMRLCEETKRPAEAAAWREKLVEHENAERARIAEREREMALRDQIPIALERGFEAGRNRNWREAAIAYAEALRNPEFHWKEYQAKSPDKCLDLQMGIVFVRAKDFASYQQLCEVVLAAHSDQPTVLEAERFAKLCFLGGTSLPANLRRQALELGRFAAAHRNEGSWPAWTCQSAGMAEYFAGDPQTAVRLLIEAEGIRDPGCLGAAMVYRSMALKKLGQNPKAAEVLRDAEAFLAGPLKSRTGAWWWDLELCQIALERARELIGQQADQ